MKKLNLICALSLGIILIYSCNNNNEKVKDASPKISINKIEDFENYKQEFNINRIRKFDSNFRYLHFYKNADCNLHFEEDSIIGCKSYIVTFNDSSNTQIDVEEFSSEKYADNIQNQLKPLVEYLREAKSKEERKKFCINYYLSRIYNMAGKDNKLYLFGYDSNNVSSESIKIDNLKNIDRICEILKE